MNLNFTNDVPNSSGVYATRFERMGKVYLYFVNITTELNVIEWTVYNAGDAMRKPISRLAGAQFAKVPDEFLTATTKSEENNG